MNRKKWKKADEGYALVENVIVMPVVFVVLFTLMFAGCVLHAQCTIDAASRRGARYAAKLICDPQYNRVTANATNEQERDLTDLSSTQFNFAQVEHYKPYRYLFFWSDMGNTKSAAEAYTRKILKQNTTWMFTIDTDSVVCDAQNYVINQNVTMKITATYHTPRIFAYLGLPEEYKLTAGDKIVVSDQDEFIRNVDYAKNLLEAAAEQLNLKEKIGKPLAKAMNFIKKIFG